ncbi:ROK family protein, partial [candidate division KSB1 bacterium]|nr:ROK family protein [candidate division KSB1 bacterium]
MKYAHDLRIVMTLDAGGTNFVFSAIQGNQEIISPLTLPSQSHNLDLCLKT